MIVAMMVIPLVDGIAKYLSGSYSPLYISWTRYFVGALIAFPVTLIIHKREALPKGQYLSQSARTIFLVGAMTCYFLAIARIPLADAIGAYFVAPIIATILSAIVLKESLNKRKVIAVVMGFVGALVIIQPGASVDIGMIYALIAGFLFACYVVATRKAATSSSPLATLNFQYLLGALLLLPFAISEWTIPDTDTLWLIGLMGLLSIVSHLLSITAFRFAQASTLSPLVYVELISTTLVGYIFFADFPTLLTWIGIAIIVASGLILIERSKF